MFISCTCKKKADFISQQNNDRRASNESSNTHAKSTYRHRTPNGYPRSRNSSQPGSRRGSNTHDSHGRDIGPALHKQLGDVQSNGQPPRKSEASAKAPGPGESSWIHRDKLARIESEELQQAAMRIHRQVRTGSKSSSMRGRSHDSHSLNGTVATPPEQTDSWQRNQLDSPIPLEDYGENEIESERMTWDLRRPEEIAAASSPGDHKGPGLKKSSSRIPVLASSPHRLSPDDADYDFADMQRPRTRTVGSGDEYRNYFSHSRRNSESAVIDSPDASPQPADNTTPPLAAASSRPGSRGNPLGQVSPTRKTPAKGTSTARKSSAPPNNRKQSSSVTKSRTASSSNANKEQPRPTTRSGETRPSTSANRPEGDPPWLATMYKPDPRLPPDQQILPTHAKKMQQEQWAKEGKTPSTYDREFAPLAVRPDDPPPPPADSEKPTPSLPVESHEFTPTWPLQSSRSPEPGRPGTSGTNYSTMPKLQTAPPVVFSVSQTLQPNFPPSPPEEPEKVDKGCGCCVVMWDLFFSLSSPSHMSCRLPSLFSFLLVNTQIRLKSQSSSSPYSAQAGRFACVSCTFFLPFPFFFFRLADNLLFLFLNSFSFPASTFFVLLCFVCALQALRSFKLIPFLLNVGPACVWEAGYIRKSNTILSSINLLP
jgi:hypothetical protein